MKTLLLSILFLVGFASSAISQSITGTITQVPCNSDGIYSVTTVGLTLPITYTYYVDYTGTPIVHANVNSTTDQLTGIDMDNSGFISCQASSGNQTVWAQNNYTPSFMFNVNGTNPVCPATMGVLTATQQTTLPGPFTYTWINNLTQTSYSGNNASVPVGNYTSIIADQTSGCQLKITDSSVYIQQLSNVTGTISVTPASCTNGSATVVPSGGTAPYTFQWINGATSASISGLSGGSYPITVTDAQGCSSNYLNAFVQQNPNISVFSTVTNATCVQSDGSAIAFGSGGVNPYTYAWSNGQTGNTATGLSGPSTYTVIATDANGCIGQGNVYVNANTPINVTYTTTPSLCTSPTGAATLSIAGGTAPYTVVWNTSPSVSGITLSGVDPGTYSFSVTDAVGCVRTGSAVISSISTLNVNTTSSQVICPVNTGNLTTTASGSNPPFTYLWNNGATTNQINNVPLGVYSCVVTDANGCTATGYKNLVSTSPLNLSVATTPVSCIFVSDGTATSTVTGGVSPYTYVYSNSTTNPNATNLGKGNYIVTATDANGCSSKKHFQVANAQTSTSCYSTISGTVYVDANADCVFDVGESGVENVMMHCSGFGYTFTDVNGFYSFQVPTGTYTITEQVNAYFPLTSCQNMSTTVSVVASVGANTVVDFANNMLVIQDLHLVTVNTLLPPIPGNNYQQKVIVTNDGTVTEGGIQLGYEHDGQLPLISSTSANFLQQNSVGAPYAYSIQSGFPSLSPGQSNTMLLNYTTPTNIPLGTNVKFYDTVANVAPIDVNWLLDYSPWNNVKSYETTVVSSYDPNYKEVYPKGEGTPGNISSDVTEFDYTVHFQNEGTYFAQNIYITDQLDADLDWTTLRPGYSDYSYTTTVSETGLVTFTFANINLPWKSGYGDALSSGLINYSIKRKLNLPQGTEFTNTADIYFDYNAPITTNTTLNTLFDADAGVEENAGLSADAITMELYPIPAHDFLTIRVNNVLQNETATLSVIDLMGNVVFSDRINLSEGTSIIKQNTSSLATGTYLTRIQFSSGSFIVKKLMVAQ